MYTFIISLSDTYVTGGLFGNNPAYCRKCDMLTRDTGLRDMVFKLNQHISHWRDHELTKDGQRYHS